MQSQCKFNAEVNANSTKKLMQMVQSECKLLFEPSIGKSTEKLILKNQEVKVTKAPKD